MNALPKLPRPVPRKAFLKEAPRELNVTNHEGERGSAGEKSPPAGEAGELGEFRGVLREFIGKKEKIDNEKRETAGASEKRILIVKFISHAAKRKVKREWGKENFFIGQTT